MEFFVNSLNVLIITNVAICAALAMFMLALIKRMNKASSES